MHLPSASYALKRCVLFNATVSCAHALAVSFGFGATSRACTTAHSSTSTSSHLIFLQPPDSRAFISLHPQHCHIQAKATVAPQTHRLMADSSDSVALCRSDAWSPAEIAVHTSVYSCIASALKVAKLQLGTSFFTFAIAYTLLRRPMSCGHAARTRQHMAA